MNSTSKSSCTLHDILITEKTSPEIARIVEQDLRYKQFEKGEFLSHDGEAPAYVMCVVSGTIKKYLMDASGHEFIVRIFKAGDIFGYTGILNNSNTIGFAQALEKVEVCCLPHNTFLNIFESEISVCNYFIKRLSYELDIAWRQIESLALFDVKKRICLLLLRLHAKFGDATTWVINVELSRDDLAKLVGIARESFSRSIRELENEKIVSFVGKKIQIINLGLLTKYGQS